jgi:hypothetical protein
VSTLIEDMLDDVDVPDELDGNEELDLPDDPAVDKPPSPPLKAEEIDYAFRKATSGFAGGMERWAERAARGMTDEELAQALKHEIGIFGGQCGPGMLGISYQGNGLRIWADRGIGCLRRKPILAGAATLAMARTVYGIRDPDEKQMSLL